VASTGGSDAARRLTRTLGLIAKMRLLELRVPPPIVGLLLGAGMWAISRETPPVDVPAYARLTVAALLLAIGCAFSLGGVIAFRRARTTVSPMKPETTSALVTDGVYRITRNPMYVGFLVILVAWAVFLSSAWALSGPVVFVLYITRFQIVPEEKALRAMFGESFTSYQAKVRRWL